MHSAESRVSGERLLGPVKAQAAPGNMTVSDLLRLWRPAGAGSSDLDRFCQDAAAGLLGCGSTRSLIGRGVGKRKDRDLRLLCRLHMQGTAPDYGTLQFCWAGTPDRKLVMVVTIFPRCLGYVVIAEGVAKAQPRSRMVTTGLRNAFAAAVGTGSALRKPHPGRGCESSQYGSDQAICTPSPSARSTAPVPGNRHSPRPRRHPVK